MENIQIKRHMSSFQIIILSFLCVIAAGTILLMLPCATQSGEGASLMDALFTSTSAACVTGLVVQNTVTYWSFFGQVVILILIQIGGMGVITMGVLLAVVSGRKIGLMQRSTMSDAIGAPQVGGIVRLTNFIILMTVVIEIAGAVLMFPVFSRDFGPLKGIWYALWHSVSAFCNAGFDLLGGRTPYASLTDYADNPLIILTISALIIIGGIGFYTWSDIREHGRHLKRYRLQSKVILVTTAVLLIVPTLVFYGSDMMNGAFAGAGTGEKFLYAFFQSVTTRTAGFNSIDLTLMKESSLMLMIILMLVGGSPGSTAGGFKTTTLAVLLASAKSVFMRDKGVNIFGRRVMEETGRSAAAILMMYLTLMSSSAIIISIIEELPILPCLFETASAIGTVGLSLGLTGSLGTVSHLILVVLMYCGRVGGLTIIFAAVRNTRNYLAQLPPEKITVG
ncbi:MAG: potassium transporter TrkG [Lachnospiraceae bacterium]|nr:potassium transporter TrkG [Lachnospiraceae bacterium]